MKRVPTPTCLSLLKELESNKNITLGDVTGSLRYVFHTVIQAHNFSSNHKEWVNTSKNCGCFHCCSIILPTHIKEWVDNGTTALCPKCGIDSIIPDNVDFLITLQFLAQMAEYWFSYPNKGE